MLFDMRNIRYLTGFTGQRGVCLKDAGAAFSWSMGAI
jgi:hypothetical protein